MKVVMLKTLIKIILAIYGVGYGSASIKREVKATKKYLKGGILIDVGANKGAYSRELLRQYACAVKELHIFEPSEDLAKNFLKFSDPRVYVNNFGLSNISGAAQLYKVSGYPGLNSLTKRRLDHFDLAMDEVEEINLTTLDAYVLEKNIQYINLLKMDVEGHELDVLKGASECLAKGIIGCIQFEFGGCNIDTRVFFRDFWCLLVDFHGFEIYRITPFGVNHIKSYSELDEIFLTTNFLAVKKVD